MAIYFFDKNQTLIKIVPESATFEAIQTQELDDDSLLKDTLSVTVKGDEKLLNAEYMAVKSYTGNAQTFDMYRIVTDTTPDKSMSFTGMSLAPYELNGHILQDLRPANHSLSYTLNRVLDGTDWRVGYIDDGLQNVTTTFYYVSAKEALKELQSLVGCEFVFKVEISGQKITDKWIEVYSEMGNRTKKRFNYGTNALTVVRETNKADIYTALIGRGKGEEVSSGEDNASGQAGYGRKITFEDIEWSTDKGNPLNKPIGQYYLELPQATQAYGIKNIDGTMKARVGIVDFDDEEDKNRLINLTYQQLLVSSRPKVLFKTTVANIGATGIGDTVTIHRHDLNIHYQTRVRKIVRNKLNDNKTQIELGDAVVTASTKQTKQNNATIKNLNNEIDKIKANVTTSQNSADGKNTIFYGLAEPERQRTGDTWYRPHPSIAGETQMLTWNGTAWELVIDTSDLTSVSRAVEDAAKKADEAVQAAKDADTKANDALKKAGANASLLDTHQNTIDIIDTTTLPAINSSVGTALSNAKSAMDEAKKADEKIANYVKENGLVSGTTVDNKIDTATGEISRKVTTLEANKLDGTTYTNFYDNEYKQTAQGVTDTWEKVNKVIDANGNSTDAFAKAVYDRNATRQTLAFNEVTKDLVTTATYEDGIDGVKDSISSVRGDIANLAKGGNNLILNSNNISINGSDSGNGNLMTPKGDLFSITPKNAGNVYGNNKFIPSETLVKGETYTLSFDVATKSQIGVYWYAVSGGGGRSGGVIPNTNGKIIRYSFTYEQERDSFKGAFLGGFSDLKAGEEIVFGKFKLEKGSLATAWQPDINDMLGQADFQVFKGTYEKNDETIKNRLTAIDSGKEGSFAYRLNETESTASGNKTTIFNIKTKPGDQITGYQTIKERSDLYERVIGKDENGVKGNISRIVQTSGIIQSEVASAVPNPNLLSGTDFTEGLGDVGVYSRTPTLSEADYFPYGKVATINTPETSGIANLGFVVKIPKKDTWYTLSFYGLTNWVGSKGVSFFSSYMKGSKNYKAPMIAGSPARHKIQITVQVTQDDAPLYVKPQGNAFRGYSNIVFYGVKLELGEISTPWENSDPATSSKVTQLSDNINLKVSKADLISQINVQAGGVLITSGTNKLNITPETTYIQDATIKSGMIQSLLADKITTGTLDAGKVKVINIDADNITSNKTSFVQSVWNSLESSIRIDSGGLLSTASDGSQTYIQNGIVGARNPGGATIGQIGYVYDGGSPTYTIQTSWGSNFAINQRFYDSYTKSTKNKEALSMYTTDNGYSETTIRMSRINILGDAHLSFLFRHSINGKDSQKLTVNGAESVGIRARDSTVFAVSNNGSTNFASLYANLNMQGSQVTNTSDIRLKRDIVNDEIDSLSALMKWQHAGFNYINPDMNQERQFSVIAQSAPDLAFAGEDGYLQVALNKQVNMTSHALQQHVIKTNDEVEQLEAQIASLQDELALLKGA